MKWLSLTLVAITFLAAQPLRADDPVLPESGFPASRYEALWTKSPFAVATPETGAGDSSPDYFLAGIANIDGISYASLIETKPPQKHFLISTAQPVDGLTLVSITQGHNGSDTFVVLLKDGQQITVKLQPQTLATAQSGAPGTQPGIPGVNSGIVMPQIPMPGSNPQQNESSRPPLTHFRRPLIHLPTPPGQQPQPPAQPANTPPSTPTPAQR